MVVIDIPPNPNCASVDTRIFPAVSSAQPVSQVRLARQAEEASWHDVTGWTSTGTPCPAMIQKVDDSGEGVAFLLHGGEAGLRLKPAGRSTAWRLDDAAQWGEPYLIVSDLSDIHIAQRPQVAAPRGRERA